jgi:hypothetical protein
MASSASDLLAAFGKVFPEAVKLIQTYPAATRLLNETVSDANQSGLTLKYGGIGQYDYPVAIGETFYSAKSITYQQPTERVMTYFMFEMQNSERALKYKKLLEDAYYNRINSDSYIYSTLQNETEGGIRVGQMWDEIIIENKKNESTLDSRSIYFRNLYLPIKNKTKTLGQTIQEVRYTKYTIGEWAGRTRQDYYLDQYNKIRSQNSALSLAGYPPIGVA